jgi:hypothetical protein
MSCRFSSFNVLGREAQALVPDLQAALLADLDTFLSVFDSSRSIG